MKRVLVAGATGYLGGFVAREFKARGHFVRALARSPRKLDPVAGSLDEVVRAEVTRPDTLEHVCDGIDVVFSSIGITRQRDKLTFRDVDYHGNVNLLAAAQRASVGTFVYVSVFDGPGLRHLDIVDAHEAFVDDLKASGIDYAVLRPNAYFSDMTEFLEMARNGRIYLIGSGHTRVNPIHGADLAEACVDAMDGGNREIDVGGPDVLTYREVADLAFRTLGRRARITTVPLWAVTATIAVTRVFSRHRAGLLAFFTTAMTRDAVAPATGSRRLSEHFAAVAGREAADTREPRS